MPLIAVDVQHVVAWYSLGFGMVGRDRDGEIESKWEKFFIQATDKIILFD